MPQRTAHHLVGELVGKALAKGCRLADLSLEELQASHPDLDAGIYDILGVEKAVSAFTSYGSTAPREVERQLHYWKAKLCAPSAPPPSANPQP
jgi:argininosuccinate lyase